MLQLAYEDNCCQKNVVWKSQNENKAYLFLGFQGNHLQKEFVLSGTNVNAEYFLGV